MRIKSAFLEKCTTLTFLSNKICETSLWSIEAKNKIFVKMLGRLTLTHSIDHTNSSICHTNEYSISVPRLNPTKYAKIFFNPMKMSPLIPKFKVPKYIDPLCRNIKTLRIKLQCIKNSCIYGIYGRVRVRLQVFMYVYMVPYKARAHKITIGTIAL